MARTSCASYLPVEKKRLHKNQSQSDRPNQTTTTMTADPTKLKLSTVYTSIKWNYLHLDQMKLSTVYTLIKQNSTSWWIYCLHLNQMKLSTPQSNKTVYTLYKSSAQKGCNISIICYRYSQANEYIRGGLIWNHILPPHSLVNRERD
jgi:hypothetical protein